MRFLACRQQFITLVAVACSLLTIAGCAQTPPKPAPAPAGADGAAGAAGAPAIEGGPTSLTFTDDAGQQVTVKIPVQRIVSIGPTNTETLFAIGAGPQVVGVDSYSDYPPETAQVPIVGDLINVSLETLIELGPELILITESSTDLRADLENLGVPVAEVTAQSLEGIWERMTLLGRLTGRDAEARDLVDRLQKRLAAVKARVDTVAPAQQVTVFHEVWYDPLMTVGSGGFIHEVIAAAGGNNIFADLSEAWPQVSLETVALRNPQVITTPFADQYDLLRAGQRAGWSGIDAVQSGRVYLVDFDAIARAGPRVSEVVEDLARNFYPDLFTQP